MAIEMLGLILAGGQGTRLGKLTKDVAIAIKFHNGLYTKDGYTISGKETKLQMILHFADMWSSRTEE